MRTPGTGGWLILMLVAPIVIALADTSPEMISRTVSPAARSFSSSCDTCAVDDSNDDGISNTVVAGDWDGPAQSESQQIPGRLALWPSQTPLGEAEKEGVNAYITVYRPEPADATGAAIVICPGGGYRDLAVECEGHRIAKWLVRHGIVGIVLEYRLPNGRPFVPLLDAQQAIRMVRLNAASWNIDPGRVGIMGFSAGGHLASTAGTHFDDGDLKASDPIDRVGCRPDFLVLVYPVITMGEKAHQGSKENLLGRTPKPEVVQEFSNERHVSNQTPPTFLTHARDDAKVSPDNSRLFYDALRAHEVEAEYLELPNGGHGLNGCKGPMWDAWQTKCLFWLAMQKIIPQNVAARR